MSAAPSPDQGPVFPDGYPRGPRLRPLYHSAWRDGRTGKAGEWSAEIRRSHTRHDPLLFGLAYLPSYLMRDTGGVISFSQMHLDICDRAVRWIDGGPDRSAWASHRTAGKSVWWFLVLPLWALAHGHRRFFLALSCTGGQATDHLDNIRGVLERGGGLVRDFPHLRPGRPWRVGSSATTGGQRLVAAGMEKTLLGARHREQRPDLIIADDLEPGEETWTPASKAKTLGRLVHDVLPAGSAAAVVALVGTPTAAGSLLHDVVRATRGQPGMLADRGAWIGAHGFDPHHYPAIVDAGTPMERSAWPTRWPLSRLRADRAAAPREFALQYQCDPDDEAAAKWWTEETFRFDAGFSNWRIASVDGAVTSNRKDADPSALVCLAVTGSTPASRRVYVESAAAGSWPRPELHERIWAWAERYPRSRKTLLVEVNQGGEMWAEALSPLPPGVTLETYHSSIPKRVRAEHLHNDYVRGAVWHARHLAALEEQMVAWRPGRAGHGVDDLIDACGAGVRRALYGDPNRMSGASR